MPSAGQNARRLDCHVHVLGTGADGTGCQLKLRSPYHHILARFILRQLGLPASALTQNLEHHYIPKLLAWVAASELDGAVILAMDHVHTDTGRPLHEFGSFYVPNDYVLALAEKHSQLLPGVSIHPARSDAISELDRCAARGAVLMKCLPMCHNINCNDPRYTKFWERMAELRIPLLAHTGGELSVPVFDKRFADPYTMTRPLEIGVTVIMAHAATSSLPFETDYSERLGHLLKKFPNLYCDNSALNTPFRSKHLKKLISEPYASRIVHGSDIPIPVSPTWAFLRGLIPWEATTQCYREKNPLQRDLLLKRALGFPETSFTLLDSLLLKNGRAT